MHLFLLLMVTSLLCLGLQFEPLASLTNWQRFSILDGQWWRILSGNFTHTNFAHLGMNLAGLWVIAFIFKPTYKALLALLVLTSLSIGGLNFFTEMNGYVGLSGVLHGLFAYFALQESLTGRKSSWLLVIGVVAKVLWEMTIGASASTSELINARVAVEAHLFGMLSGLVCAVISVVIQSQRRQQSQTQE
ncbi:rhombosortase [Vibrio aquaticus]|uniref:Rhombosortase n=1 Tax=Vibrio aquaticus TaxID=2496559 RepID=A0A3S0QE35_9VIBR|nr:rhombosortase [Vibrio aquaticus]RTZ16481.1 rhombosortase [Vibrio aquaticus]